MKVLLFLFIFASVIVPPPPANTQILSAVVSKSCKIISASVWHERRDQTDYVFFSLKSSRLLNPDCFCVLLCSLCLFPWTLPGGCNIHNVKKLRQGGERVKKKKKEKNRPIDAEESQTEKEQNVKLDKFTANAFARTPTVQMEDLFKHLWQRRVPQVG